MPPHTHVHKPGPLCFRKMIAILATLVLKVAAVIYASDTSSMQMSGRGVGRCVVARRNQPPECRRTKVQLSGYYGGRMAGREDSYSFSGALI